MRQYFVDFPVQLPDIVCLNLVWGVGFYVLQYNFYCFVAVLFVCFTRCHHFTWCRMNLSCFVRWTEFKYKNNLFFPLLSKEFFIFFFFGRMFTSDSISNMYANACFLYLCFNLFFFYLFYWLADQMGFIFRNICWIFSVSAHPIQNYRAPLHVFVFSGFLRVGGGQEKRVAWRWIGLVF